MAELTPKQFAGVIKKSIVTLARWRRKKYGPPFVKEGSRVLYDTDDYRAWRERQKRSNVEEFR